MGIPRGLGYCSGFADTSHLARIFSHFLPCSLLWLSNFPARIAPSCCVWVTTARGRPRSAPSARAWPKFREIPAGLSPHLAAQWELRFRAALARHRPVRSAKRRRHRIHFQIWETRVVDTVERHLSREMSSHPRAKSTPIVLRHRRLTHSTARAMKAQVGLDCLGILEGDRLAPGGKR